MKKILFATDFTASSLNAFGYCLLLAKNMEATIKVLHVVAPDGEEIDLPLVSAFNIEKRIDEIMQHTRRFVQLGIDQFSEKFNLLPLPTIEEEVQTGYPAEKIVQEAEKDADTIIMVASGDDKSWLNQFFGSVSLKVLRNSENPVLVVPENWEIKPPKTIVVATDLHEEDVYRVWKTADWFTPFQSELKIVHIQKEQEEKKEISLADLQAMLIDKIALPTTFAANPQWDKSVADTLLSYADTQHANLIVIPKRERSWWERLFHQSVTSNMVWNGNTPVLRV